MTRPLRFGVMIDGPVLPAYRARAVEALLALPEAELALVIRPKVGGLTGKLRRLAAQGRRFGLSRAAFAVYRGVLLRVPALRKVDISAALAGAPEMVCTPVPVGRHGHALDDEACRTIRAAGLDFILRFAFGILKGDVLHAATHGVWSLHHNDERRYRGKPPVFWELAEGDRVCGAILQRLTERLDGGVVLRRGRFQTEGESYPATLNKLLLRSAEWPARVAAAAARAPAGEGIGEASASRAPVRRAPTNRQFLAFVLRSRRSEVRGRMPEGRLELFPGPAGDALPAGGDRWIRPEASGMPRHCDYLQLVNAGSLLLVRGEDEAGALVVVQAQVFPRDPARPLAFEPVRIDGLAAEWFCATADGSRTIGLARSRPGDPWLIVQHGEEPAGWTGSPASGLPAWLHRPVIHPASGGGWLVLAGDGRDPFGRPEEVMRLFRAAAPTGPWQEDAASPVVEDCLAGRSAGPLLRCGDRQLRPSLDRITTEPRVLFCEVLYDGTQGGYAEAEPCDLAAVPALAFTACGRLTAVIRAKR